MRSRLKALIWLFFPILVMGLVTVAAVLVFFAYDKNNQVVSDPSLEPLDLTAPDAAAQLRTRYLESKGDPAVVLGDLELSEKRFFGLLSIERERFLFEIESVRGDSVTVTFTSDGRSFDFDVIDGQPKSLAVNDRLIPSRLEELASYLAEIFSGFVNPMHGVLVNPESYSIEQLERTRLGGLPVLAVTINKATDPGGQAVAYLDEPSLQTIALKTALHSKRMRNYQLIYNGDNEAALFPDEIQFSSRANKRLEILINRGTRGSATNP